MPGRVSWKSERTFEVTVRVRRPVHDIRDLLANPRGWLKFHPLILELIDEPRRPGHLRVVERLTFAGVPMIHRYRAFIQPHADGVEGEAWSVPFIHVRSRMRWVAEGDGATLSESVRVTAPAPIIWYVERTARRAHQTMLDGIRGAMEAPASQTGPTRAQA